MPLTLKAAKNLQPVVQNQKQQNQNLSKQAHLRPAAQVVPATNSHDAKN